MTDTIEAPRQDAFHALGTAIPEGMTPEEALAHAHMTGWNVRKEPLVHSLADPRFISGGGYRQVPVPGKHVVLRDSPFTGEPEGLGTVGDQWTPFANESGVKLLTDITDESGGSLSTVGVYNGGRKIFLSMKMPSHMLFTSPITGEVDETDLYLNLFNDHVGQGSLTGMVSAIRLFCCNQQAVAEATARSKFRIRHTGDMAVHIEEIRRMLSLTFKYEESVAAEFQKMIDREIENAIVYDIFKTVAEVDKGETERQRDSRTKVADGMFEVYKQSDTVAPFRGLRFGAYNAVTEYVDHYMPVGKGGDSTQKRALRTITSQSAENMKIAAYDLLQVV